MVHFSILLMLLIIIIIISIDGIIMAMPRLPADSSSHSGGIADKQAEFDYDKWRTTSRSSGSSQLNAEQPDPASSPSSFIEQIGRMELVQSIMRFVERLGFGTGEQDDEKMTQRIERQSPATKSVEEQHREIFGKRRHFDSPMRANANNVRSPTIRRISAKEQPQISSSIDSRPMTIAKPSEEQRYEQQRPATAAAQPQLNGMASFHEAIGKEWKQALFGRGGLLTEVFNFVNDKRKEDLAKQQAAPNLNDKASTEFSRIVDALLRKAKSGNFDEEPLPEIPFIGICNRLSCADIYKALDQFRKSEFFSNFQTAISLLQDPKGLDMIGELLANPELIENFSGPESVGDLFGTTKKAASKSGGDGTRRVEIGENTDAENIGVDFSSLIDGPNNNSNVKMPPSIASSIDSAAPDYYSFSEDKVGSKADKLEDKTPKKEMVVTPKQRGGGGSANVAKSVQSTKTNIDFSRELPEISESIDGGPPEDEDIPGGDMLVFEKNEWLPSASSANSNGTTKKQQFVLTPLVDVRVGQDKKKVSAQQTVHAHATTQISRPRSKAGGEHNRTTTTTTEKTSPSRARTQTNSSSSSSSTTNRKTVTTPPATTTTRRNFRRDDDYYSMYYDGESG
uniref:CUE domain-containing protein n=1 Tax=Globodera pallida TaxID=36090 RepID=A0A183BLV3_GLOPA